ncbi:MAG: MbtH family NRPS accessory protein [Polyangiales bacterium]
MSWDDEDTVFQVVMNHEEQYSIWPTYKDVPNGWSAVGPSGKKAECLEYIDRVWTDMRPLSLRRHMDEAARAGARSRGVDS